MSKFRKKPVVIEAIRTRDAIRAAALSEGGKPIIALPSSTKHGESRIVAQLTGGRRGGG